MPLSIWPQRLGKRHFRILPAPIIPRNRPISAIEAWFTATGDAGTGNWRQSMTNEQSRDAATDAGGSGSYTQKKTPRTGPAEALVDIQRDRYNQRYQWVVVVGDRVRYIGRSIARRVLSFISRTHCSHWRLSSAVRRRYIHTGLKVGEGARGGSALPPSSGGVG